jgi:lipopolysaccharide/colanic/teichoic acid biosynthesis glycosyltransferase
MREDGLTPYHARKPLWDRALAGLLLLLSLPLLLVLIVIVGASSPGPPIYKQVRVGKNGRRFKVFKIRTMYADAEAVGGPQWAQRKDPRVTPVGRALRFLHLDELPQLINVVRGEMSLVGPRPERPEFVEHLVRVVPNYCERLKVLPGITGLAQINLPPDDSLDSVRRKSIVDAEYLRTATAVLDVRILVCTALRMLGVRHGRAPRWLGVEYRFCDSSPCSSDASAAFCLDAEELDVAAFNGRLSHDLEERHVNGHVKAADFEFAAVSARSKTSVAAEQRPFVRRRPK